VPGRDRIEGTIRSYCSAWTSGDRAQWLAAFRDDATQEDPIGGAVRRGHIEIGAFFDDGLRHWSGGLSITPERIHVLGHEAAMVWHIEASRPDERIEFEGVDVFTFDDDAQISTVRAYWEDRLRRRFSPTGRDAG
jgi:steroid delta-isomerase